MNKIIELLPNKPEKKNFVFISNQKLYHRFASVFSLILISGAPKEDERTKRAIISPTLGAKNCKFF